MTQKPSKEGLVDSLPLACKDLMIRRWTREDVDTCARWPRYGFPYEAFDLGFRAVDSAERDRVYRDREARPDAITLAVDGDAGACLAYLALYGIDWASGQVRSLGFRIHPHHCG